MQSNRKSYFQFSDFRLIKIHKFLYITHKYPNIFFITALYISVILLWGERLGISGNYFIFFPLIGISVSFGLSGGFIAGIFALPANLLLFEIIGHPEFSPDNKLITELFGIFVGSFLGYISDFFNMMLKEIELRRNSEKELEHIVKEKEILLKEVHHRVKNNLNLIKSIIQLQSNRVNSIKQQNELQKLNRRIITIAMVQDLLFSQESLDMLDFRHYLKELIESLISGFTEMKISYYLILCENPVFLESKKITSLGLIINEAVTNAMKYAFNNNKSPKLHITLSVTKETLCLLIKDNGPGYPQELDETGLGLKLIKTLTINLHGRITIQNNNGGELLLKIPVKGIYEEQY